VTITGINFNTATDTGMLSLIDPLGGMASTVNITGLSLGNLNTNYSGGASVRAVYVETPVPEPAVLLLMSGGVLTLRVMRRRQ
jgi:hypothetical protein